MSLPAVRFMLLVLEAGLGALCGRWGCRASLRASSAGTGAVKNTQACAPTPDREGAAGLDVHEGVEHRLRAVEVGRHQHRSTSSSGYRPIWASPFRCAGVVPDRVHIGPGGEQRAEERHLRVLRRPVMHDSRDRDD